MKNCEAVHETVDTVRHLPVIETFVDVTLAGAKTIDNVLFGALSILLEGMGYVINETGDCAATVVRRGVRMATGNPLLGQELGDWTGAGVKFFAPGVALKGIPRLARGAATTEARALGAESTLSKQATRNLEGLDLAKPVSGQRPDGCWYTRGINEWWKSKIFGRAQATGSDVLHQSKSYAIAIEAAKHPEVTHVYLNRGIHKALEDMGRKELLRLPCNRRPDVMFVTRDGKVHFCEVASKTDVFRNLKLRMDKLRQTLPESMRGTQEAFEITDTTAQVCHAFKEQLKKASQ